MVESVDAVERGGNEFDDVSQEVGDDGEDAEEETEKTEDECAVWRGVRVAATFVDKDGLFYPLEDGELQAAEGEKDDGAGDDGGVDDVGDFGETERDPDLVVGGVTQLGVVADKHFFFVRRSGRRKKKVDPKADGTFRKQRNRFFLFFVFALEMLDFLVTVTKAAEVVAAVVIAEATVAAKDPGMAILGGGLFLFGAAAWYGLRRLEKKVAMMHAVQAMELELTRGELTTLQTNYMRFVETSTPILHETVESLVTTRRMLDELNEKVLSTRGAEKELAVAATEDKFTQEEAKGAVRRLRV